MRYFLNPKKQVSKLKIKANEKLLALYWLGSLIQLLDLELSKEDRVWVKKALIQHYVDIDETLDY